MSQETLIIEPIVESIPINWESAGKPARARLCEGNRIDAGLERICALDPTFPLLLSGRAHGLVFGPSGTAWARTPDGGAKGQIVMAPRDRPTRWVRIGFILVKARGPGGWLTLDYNPTTVLGGDNIHPATYAETGEIPAAFPSSSGVIQRLYRLGFYLLDDLVRQATDSRDRLFDPATRGAIERGEARVVRAQFCAYLPTVDLGRFLQVMVLMFGHSIARGKGIVQLAGHLGLKFSWEVDKRTHQVTYILLRKMHGTKPLFSLVFYNKEVRLRQVRQRKGLPADETATVLENVRFDVTLHSEGVKALVAAARSWAKSVPEGKNDSFDRLRNNKVFMAAEPKSTVSFLERAIFVLSHRLEGDGLRRRSFASWLVPYMLRRVLRLDVLAKFTSESLNRFLELDDDVAVAWRNAKPSELGDWAGNLAKNAGCSRETVYARQRNWLAEHHVDIALPYALYRDLLQYGGTA